MALPTKAEHARHDNAALMPRLALLTSPAAGCLPGAPRLRLAPAWLAPGPCEGGNRECHVERREREREEGEVVLVGQGC